MSRRKSSDPKLAAGALLIALAIVAHSPGLFAGFVIDDAAYVTENETLRDLDGLRNIWLDLDSSPQYYPLVFTSFWMEYQLWGATPTGYHASNIALHAVNALLVWILLARLAVPGAWLAAVIFAVHPVHVESVAWVAERKNVLSALFYLGSVLGFLRFRDLERQSESRKALRILYCTALLLFLLAMLSKTASVSLPVVLLLLVWWKRGRLGRRDLMKVGPMFAIGLALALITVWIETTRGGASGELWNLSWIERILLACRSIWFYAGKLIWPTGLSFNYSRWSVDSGVWWQYLYPLALGATLWALWRWRASWGRGPLTSVLYFIVTLGPTLGFVNIYFFRYSYVADHFLYLSSIGLIALGVAIPTVRTADYYRQIFIPLSVLAASVVSILIVLTWQRTWIFRDLEALCLDTKAKNPSSWLAVNNLGNIYLERGDLESATSELEIAREIAPSYIETHLNLAIAYMNQGRFEEAIASSSRAIELKPENVFGYKYLADSYLRSGDPEAAIPWYQRAVTMDPDYAEARSGLGSALARSGRFELAVEVLSESLESDPHSVPARTSLAIALAQLGRDEEAVVEFEKALALEPDNATLRENLELARRKAAAGVLQGED